MSYLCNTLFTLLEEELFFNNLVNSIDYEHNYFFAINIYNSIGNKITPSFLLRHFLNDVMILVGTDKELYILE